MKILYIECNMGAAGDMLTAALSELLPDPDAFVATMNAAGIPGMTMQRGERSSCGVRGTHMAVEINGEEEVCPDVPGDAPEEAFPADELDHAHCDPSTGGEPAHPHPSGHAHGAGSEHAHASLAEVCARIDRLQLPLEVRNEARQVYALLAEAEAHVHGCDADSLHFHEVGMLDAITDVCAVCLLMHELRPDRVVVSPIHTGFGQVRCAHGILPVPTPATAYLLRGVPAGAGSIRGELLTPTGAALLKHFASEFGWMPEMRVTAVGCGMGSKDFPAANCVRVFLGEDEAQRDEVCELSCNLDDMTGESIAFAMEELLNAGALDVYLTPIQMKKGRPGVKLNCLCRPEDRSPMEALMLRHTSTLGVRGQRLQRRVLSREQRKVSTPYGEIGVKVSHGADTSHLKPEYEDVARAARANSVPLSEVQRAVEREL